MLLNDYQIALLKSITVRPERSTRHLLMNTATVADFQFFLQQEIQNEVFIVSTNIGMEVFYLSTYDCSDLIKKGISEYVSRIYTTEIRLLFKNNTDGVVVYQSFLRAIQMFSKYPQVFLAYSKKFLVSLEQNKDQGQLVATLLLFYQVVLEKLKVAGTVPHLQKIEKLYHTIAFKVSVDSEGFLQNKLAKVMLRKVHSN